MHRVLRGANSKYEIDRDVFHAPNTQMIRFWSHYGFVTRQSTKQTDKKQKKLNNSHHLKEK